jgi:hypothetical protein
MPDKIIHRILQKLNQPGLDDLLINKLKFSELQSLLLHVFNRKVTKLDIAGLFREYRTNRLVQPSSLDPRRLLGLESGLFSLLPDHFSALVINHKSEYGRNYYRRMRFMINFTNNRGQSYDLIDGGFTNWTSELMKNNKERLMTSGIGTELLLKTLILENL